jgi:hypothetical protein
MKSIDTMVLNLMTPNPSHSFMVNQRLITSHLTHRHLSRTLSILICTNLSLNLGFLTPPQLRCESLTIKLLDQVDVLIHICNAKIKVKQIMLYI